MENIFIWPQSKKEFLFNKIQRDNAKRKGLIKSDCIKNKLFNKRHLKSEQSSPKSGDGICTHAGNKEWAGEIYKGCPQINKKEKPIGKWVCDWNTHFTEETQVVNKHKLSISPVINKILIKTTMRYHFIPIKLAKWKADNDKCLWGYGQDTTNQ